MYVGRRHIAKLELRQVLAFTCKHCRYATDALVSATGRGQGSSPFFLDNAGAAERAAERAEADARGNLLETLALASCPKCGHRDGRAHAWSIFKAGVAATLLGAGVAAFAYLEDLSRGPVVGLAIAAAAALFAVLQRVRLSAGRRVLFPPVPTKPRVSVPAASLPLPSPPRPPAPHDPYRGPASAPPIRIIETARPLAPSPVAASASPDDGPKLLK